MANNEIYFFIQINICQQSGLWALSATLNVSYLAFSRVSLHELIGFKFFFLVWHHSWHFEKELWSGDDFSLLVVLGVVVGGRRRVEHVTVV